MPLVEQERLILPEYLTSPGFCGIHATWSLALCVCFVDRCLSFSPFSFSHCVFCPSISGFWLPLWYLQTLLLKKAMCPTLSTSDSLWNIKFRFSDFLSQALQKPQIKHNQLNKRNMTGAPSGAGTVYSFQSILNDHSFQIRLMLPNI